MNKVSIICATALSIAALFFAAKGNSAYVYEADQDLFNLTSLTGTTNFNTGDDQLAGAFNLDFTFTLYGEDFTSARMATNGCLHFGLGTGNVNYNNYCGDYTPDPLPHTNYTLYPFYTDLIRDGGSKMLAKNFTDKAVFGWYNMKEYGRNNTDNSFEVILWTNDTFEYRYGDLNITNHDVLIGEQGSATEIYTYLFHDECNTGTTNVAGTCVNTNWNGTASNTLLEDGGSLYGEGSGNAIDCSDPLNNSSCSGYAAAYLAQQCGINALHSTSCPLYWEAYDDQQCEEDPQYAPFCAGYTQEASVAYYIEEEFDYGYEEEFDYGYEDEHTTDSYGITEEFVWEDDYGYEEDIWFEEDYAWVEEEIWFEEELLWEDPYIETIDFIEYIETYDYEEEFVFYEEQYEPIQHLEIFDAEDLTELYEFETIIREELPYEEEENYLAFEDFEELEEWFEEEMEEIQEEHEGSEEETEELYAEAEEEIFEEEAVEEIYEELEEEWVAEAEEEALLEESEEADVVGLLVDREEGSSMNMETALNVVASTVQAAANSVSGTTAGTSVHATGNTRASGGASSSYGGSSSGSGGSGVSGAVASSSSGSSFSTSSSPSLSDQFTAASVQTNTILSMSADTGSVSNVTTTSSPMPTTEVSVEVATVETQVQDMQGQIDTAMSEVSTPSEADQVADQIVAQNLQEQQEQAQASQEETGEYGDQSVFVAYLGYNAGFTDYYGRDIPKQTNWYEPRAIYTDVKIDDNINAFYKLAGDNLNTLTTMKALQPDLRDGVF